MALTAEWRTNGIADAILVVDDGDNTVREALAANADRLGNLLTEMGELESWLGERAVAEDKRDPSAWGDLVISRASSGEIITMDPERFWNGVYEWFRSRGVDYDSARR
jgi:hypothetical protein